MPWKETEIMDERARFVLSYHSGLYSISELCDYFGISRPTAYKWLQRHKDHGIPGLENHSRAPKSCPHRTSQEVAAQIIALRKCHPNWGPRKLIQILGRQDEANADKLCAASTAGDILKREGLVQKKRRRTRSVHPGSKPLVTNAPNDVWCADFKGEFRTGNGQNCYPLTITDAHSRYLLECTGLTSTNQLMAREVFERLFFRAGLPAAIRTDNGSPFCTNAICGLSRLGVWWIKLGIAHQRISPGKPQQNGAHERMHRTLKAETTRPPGGNIELQQRIFDQFIQDYNLVRPHEALQMQTPSMIWEASNRTMPSKLPKPEYAGHQYIRNVRHNGEIKFKGERIFLSEVLEHEPVALEETDDGIWSIYFYHKLLGRLDERLKQIVPCQHSG